jgi:hypothetical protein
VVGVVELSIGVDGNGPDVDIGRELVWDDNEVAVLLQEKIDQRLVLHRKSNLYTPSWGRTAQALCRGGGHPGHCRARGRRRRGH